jgi:hypothetical protein
MIVCKSDVSRCGRVQRSRCVAFPVFPNESGTGMGFYWGLLPAVPEESDMKCRGLTRPIFGAGAASSSLWVETSGRVNVALRGGVGVLPCSVKLWSAFRQQHVADA